MIYTLLSLVWIVVGFFAIRLAAQRFFHEKQRADIAAIAIVGAFVVGALWRPFPSDNANAGAAASAASVVGAVCYRPSAINAQQQVPLRRDTDANYSGALDALAVEPEGPMTSNFRAACNIFGNGWVANLRAKTPANGVVFVLDSHRVIDVTPTYRKPRPDVAKAFRSPGMLKTGFSGAVIPTTGLAAGPHTVQLGALSRDGKSYYLIGVPVAITLK